MRAVGLEQNIITDIMELAMNHTKCDLNKTVSPKNNIKVPSTNTRTKVESILSFFTGTCCTHRFIFCRNNPNQRWT